MGKSAGRFEHAAPLALLLLLLSFHGIMGWVWIHENQALQGVDEIDYFQVLQRFERTWPVDWSSPLHNLKVLTDSIEQTSYPPFAAVVGKISLDLFGRSPTSPRLVSWMAYLGVMVLLFLLGWKIGGPRAGILAAAVFACFPFAMQQSRFYNIHMINAFMITLAIGCLIQSREMTSVGWMILFGMISGLALLTERGTAPLYLLGPVAAYAIGSGIRRGRKMPEKLLRPALLLCLAAAIAALLAGRYLHGYLVYQGDYIASNVAQPFYPDRTEEAYYLNKLFRWYTGVPFGLLLWIGAILLFLKKPYWKKAAVVLAVGWILTGPIFSDDARVFFWTLAVCASLALCDLNHRWVLVAWLLVPLILFSVIATRSVEYLFASLPALALAIAMVAVKLTDWRAGRWIVLPFVGITIAFSLFQTVVISFSWPEGRALYRKMPACLRFAGGNEKLYPLPSLRKETAEKILAATAPGKSGLYLYLPGERRPDEHPEQGNDYLPNALSWAMELQVWMAFLQPGLHHIVIGDRIVAMQPWKENRTDLVAWIPPAEGESELMEKIQQQKRINPIMIVNDPQAAEPVFENVNGLPGETLEELHVISGRRLLVTRPLANQHGTDAP